MKEFTSNTEFESFIADNKFVLIDFYAIWCGPCKKVSSTLDELGQEITDVAFAKVNIELLPDLAEKTEIEVVPTLILYKDGIEIDRREGAAGKTALKAWITKG